MISHWSRFIKQSVSRKLAFYIISLGLLVATLALVLRVVLSYQKALPLFKAHIQKNVESALPLIHSALEKNDATELIGQMSRLTSTPEIEALVISWRDASGNLRVITFPRSYTDFKYPYRVAPLRKTNGRLVDIKVESIKVDLSMGRIIDKLKDEAIKNAVIILLEAVIIALTLIRFMEVLFARHLRDMASFARRLDLSNLDESFRLSRKGKRLVEDELDELSLALNKMRERLQDDVRERQVMELSLALAKEDEGRARRKQLAAEATNKAKSLFIATISHEIRTPMNGILGMTDLLSRTTLNDVQRHYIETIQYSGESLTRVINDVLDYAKMESDSLQLNVECFNVEELVDECVRLFSEPSAQNQIDLYSSIHPKVPRVLQGDPTRLRQILLILLGNAFKFTRKGFVSLKVMLKSSSEPSSIRLKFLVEDSGIGVCREAQQDLFKPFNQADGSITREHGGTGLGLAIAKSLVDLMSGEMGVESQEGRGSCFWFTAKLDAVEKVSVENGSTLSGKSVLLVSADEALNIGVLEACQSFRMVCKVVNSGFQAAQEFAFESHRKAYDVVLVNSSLPDKSSDLLVDEIRGGCIDQRFIVFKSLQCAPPLLGSNERILIKPISNINLRRALENLLLPSQAPTSYESPLFSNLKVLVAEDNIVNALVIEGILNKLDASYLVVENGQLACLAYQADTSFDVVLMDCEMPIMDGFAATRVIREWEVAEELKPVKIVAVTAHVETEYQKSGLNCGMDYYLSKPVSLGALAQVLKGLGFSSNQHRSFEI